MSKDGPGSSSRFDDFAAADQGGSGPAGFFRGAELSKLLVLLVLAIAGWVLVWNYIRPTQEPPEEPDPAARLAPPRVEPDKSPAFESVTDWLPIGLRDMAAYDLLLKRARGTPVADLARQSHRDILYTDLWERPDHFRGVPVHLLGTARRIHSYPSKKSATGRLYEAWVSTHESQGNPYVCIFEDLPRGMPVGPVESERVVFNGYFLKEMRYVSGKDIPRAAPVLVGKIGWTPGRSAFRRDNSVSWMIVIVGILFTISLFRWVAGLRRSLSPRSRAHSLIRRPTDEIAPDDLAQWVESVQREEGEDPHEHEPEDHPR